MSKAYYWDWLWLNSCSQPNISGAKSKCIKQKLPKCRSSMEDTFITGEYGLMSRDGFRFSDSKNLTIEGCKVKCLLNCNCLAFATTIYLDDNITGCEIWTSSAKIKPAVNGNARTIYILPSRENKWWLWLTTAVGLMMTIPTLCSVCYIIWKKCKSNGDEKYSKRMLIKELDGGETPCISFGKPKGHKADRNGLHVFSFESIAYATNYFSPANKLGEGGFGPVYKGILHDGQEVAIKRLSANSRQGVAEFKNEALLIAKLQHTNLVKLLGFCIQGEENILIYEYMPNKSLDSFLFDSDKKKILNWKRRFIIIEGIAQGLLYLHKYSRLRVIHRDLKASNILLDHEMNPKISDFGMARIFGLNESEANTNRVVGTYGYMSPEYAFHGLVSIKTDVFSFGVLLLEVVTGRKNATCYHPDYPLNLTGYVWQLWNEGRQLELIDPSMDESCPHDEILRRIHIGLLCVQDHAIDRPTILDVVIGPPYAIKSSELNTFPMEISWELLQELTLLWSGKGLLLALLPSGAIPRPQSALVYQDMDDRVSALIDVNKGCWKEGDVRQQFCAEDAESILHIPLKQIRSTNGINTQNPLKSGKKLVIPLPCTCFDNVNNGIASVYMSYVVQRGDSLASIGAQFGVSTMNVVAVNGLSQPGVDPGDILSSQLQLYNSIINVILLRFTACSSANLNWYNESLIVPNGSSALTANNCIKCSYGQHDLNLRCGPSGIETTCSQLQCKGSELFIGDSHVNQTATGCNITTCVYRGHLGGKIFRSLANSSQAPCPGNPIHRNISISITISISLATGASAPMSGQDFNVSSKRRLLGEEHRTFWSSPSVPLPLPSHINSLHVDASIEDREKQMWLTVVIGFESFQIEAQRCDGNGRSAANVKFSTQESPDYLRELIRKTRSLTDKPFGIGVVLAFPHEENIKAILEEKVAVLQLYWGECSQELVMEAHNAGVKVIPQVSKYDEKIVHFSLLGALRMQERPLFAIIVQGREAGGHVIGQDGLISLVRRAVDLVGNRDIPIIAAGGIVDARGYVAGLALGAKGVCLGTRFEPISI
ncbi:hypothetical protein SLEP1_g36224 [Rubroshorea leprosula]|uniref:non-specific serine/threonine protein kinase n=1 Tax=Rubroshorea leprosula TaxID=152421 RepID=A0AAV5KQS4_9ROSI|nr:hypothetical protein SLEP1_g36224 [Rubroshorea leprosula]